MLAGGRSSRMGSDKAQLRLAGATLLERAIAVAEETGFAVAVSVAAGSSLIPLLSARGITTIRDRLVEQGPLAGIVAALDVLACDLPQRLLFVPVDTPRLPAHFLRWLWQRSLSSNALAILPAVGGREQPLCAVYSGELAAPLRDALVGGERKVIRALRRIVPAERFDCFDVEVVAPLMGWHQPQYWFTNVNTPRDWAELQADPFRGDPAANRIYKGDEVP